MFLSCHTHSGGSSWFGVVGLIFLCGFFGLPPTHALLRVGFFLCGRFGVLVCFYYLPPTLTVAGAFGLTFGISLIYYLAKNDKSEKKCSQRDFKMNTLVLYISAL